MDENLPKKELYSYQQTDLERIFKRLAANKPSYNLLYQLPTGGGKTVIFSEIARRFIEKTNKKVLILTHRIELSRQTSKMLTEFGVKTKIIDSKVKELEDQEDYDCFVAMVETLNNRLNDEVIKFPKVGLVIVDEAHYNSFRKLFHFFEECTMIGVTATPLSSNINLPMKDIYDELLVGHPIEYLIENGFLAKANTYSYDVGLGTLKIGINGDYTVKSSELLYTNALMQGKLLHAYKERAEGRKTLIFNNGINTSRQVLENFKDAKIPIRHIDSLISKSERVDALEWFKNTPGAVITSVGILTTGFDEPSIETIVLNRATRSPTLYYQMIGRGSRIWTNKKEFEVIDLGNNVARFGLWEAPVDWQKIFQFPTEYLESIISDEEIERYFVYRMPQAVKARFSKSEDISFDIKAAYEEVKKEGVKSAHVMEKSRSQHLKMVLDNAEDLPEALELSKLLYEDIDDRIRRYAYLIANSTRNYRDWLSDDYKGKLRREILREF